MSVDMDLDPRNIAINLARDLRAKFYEQTSGNRLPISINTEKFAEYVSKAYDVEIISEVTTELGEHLRGMLLREHKRKAVILIADSNNECWRRFVFMKELCHLFIDDDRSYCEDAEGLAIGLVSEDASVHGTNNVLQSEYIALFAAIEIMIPDYLRNWLAHEANVDGKTPYQIASKLKVPKKYVEYRAREWGHIKLNPEENSDH